MAINKVYVIEPDFEGIWREMVSRRDRLGREIAALAKDAGEQVWFHDHVDPMMGAPVIMLECAPEFLERVKELSGIAAVNDLRDGEKTQRNARIQAYFSGVLRGPDSPRP